MGTNEAEAISLRVHTLIFNGISKGVRDHGTLASASNRERIADAVYAELWADGIQVRLRPTAASANRGGGL